MMQKGMSRYLIGDNTEVHVKWWIDEDLDVGVPAGIDDWYIVRVVGEKKRPEARERNPKLIDRLTRMIMKNEWVKDRLEEKIWEDSSDA